MINYKNIFKLISVIALAFASVFICTIFVNYLFDLKDIIVLISDPESLIVYHALVTQANVAVVAVGGTLGITTFVVLLFSIKQFINENSAQLGVLKALGYSENVMAVKFIKFGCCILLGALPAYLLAYVGSPLFYGAFNGSENLNIKIVFGFHIETILILIVAPTVFFSILSFIYARMQLSKSALGLIKGENKNKVNKVVRNMQQASSNVMFLKELKRNMLFQNLALIFFVWFAAFGFAACVQIGFSFRQITDAWITTAIFILLGILTGIILLFLALSFVINRNKKYISVLKAYGYTKKEYNHALFGGYRIVTLLGFLCGTIYQFVLLKNIAFLFVSMYEVPEIQFDYVVFLVTLAAFVALYEIIMLFYKRKISKITLREIMQLA